MLFSDRPSVILFSIYKNNRLRLPSLYAMIILLLFLCDLLPIFGVLLSSLLLMGI